jgi:cytoskeletal protein RodZ
METIPHVPPPAGWAPAAGHQDDGRSGFGEWLTQARQARGLTLDDISRETKIPLRNLEALEHGNLGVIPAFYERAEVRAVARAVGIDERLAMGRLDTAITPAVEARPERKEEVARPGLKPSVALVFVTLAIGVLAAAGIGRAVFNRDTTAQRAGNSVATAGSTAAASSGADAAVAPGSPQDSVVLASADAAQPLAAPESAAPVAAASFTEIVVTTDPPGARVTVNGISWGVSPVTIRHLPPGAKRIRATKEGFAASEQVVPLDEGQRQTLNLRLLDAE